ncbi:alcohol acetyltransferase [Phaeosphaeriaceae sp. PMI808]|nr:alcohol acetyltransferase [Phaeosphaeriaceae sp. PMI808]
MCTSFFERKGPFFPTEAGEVDGEIDALLESQHRELHWRDDVGTKAFWRIIVVRSPGVENQFVVSWIFHHGLSDGTSGLVFHGDLLAALNSFKGKQTLEDGPMVETPKTDLIPALEKLHKLPFTLPFVLQSLWRDWFPKRHPKLWTGAKITNDPKFKTLKFRTVVLSKQDTLKLLQSSRENKTTLTGALECITSSAVLANLDPSKHDRVTVDGAVSFRRFITLPDIDIEDQIGVYVSVYMNEHVNSISSEGKTTSQATALDIFSWAEARAVRSVIDKEIAKHGTNSRVSLIRWLGNLNSFWLSKVGKEREETFEVTNIGVWKPKPEEENGDWKVGRMIFSQCSGVTGPAFALSIATGRDGCLVLSFSWLEGIVEGSLMEKIIASVEECMARLVSG